MRLTNQEVCVQVPSPYVIRSVWSRRPRAWCLSLSLSFVVAIFGGFLCVCAGTGCGERLQCEKRTTAVCLHTEASVLKTPAFVQTFHFLQELKTFILNVWVFWFKLGGQIKGQSSNPGTRSSGVETSCVSTASGCSLHHPHHVGQKSAGGPELVIERLLTRIWSTCVGICARSVHTEQQVQDMSKVEVVSRYFCTADQLHMRKLLCTS